MKETVIIRKISNGVIVEKNGKEFFYPDAPTAIREIFDINEVTIFSYGNKRETLITVELSEVVRSIDKP